MEWFQEASYWHWWVLAVVLIILEVISPAIFFLWMGIAAGVVGLLVLIVPGMAWELQVVLFSAFSVASVVLGRRYLSKHPIESEGGAAGCGAKCREVLFRLNYAGGLSGYHPRL